LGNLPSAILWTWPYHVSWFCSISFIIVSSSPICCLINYISNSIFSWYSRGSSQVIHLCSFKPSFIIFCDVTGKNWYPTSWKKLRVHYKFQIIKDAGEVNSLCR
jgi:hypothetical protein